LEKEFEQQKRGQPILANPLNLFMVAGGGFEPPTFGL